MQSQHFVSTIFPHNWAKFQLSSTFLSQVLFENVFLRYRNLKLRDTFSAKNGPFWPNIFKNLKNKQVFVLFYDLVRGGT